MKLKLADIEVLARKGRLAPPDEVLTLVAAVRRMRTTLYKIRFDQSETAGAALRAVAETIEEE